MRAVGINLGNDQILTANDPVMRQEPTIYIWDVEDETDGTDGELNTHLVILVLQKHLSLSLH